ncbi:hypothetical protein KIL84_003563 [Mauremys mutica]|uniref:Uncharacterized protein n=1 Tax=Mauremys mutica TaxID=74926 RepID=A0A9D3WW48_9SAUR|nr:hypothetical protein KIL84_003563 [Mauremys mutica]
MIVRMLSATQDISIKALITICDVFACEVRRRRWGLVTVASILKDTHTQHNGTRQVSFNNYVLKRVSKRKFPSSYEIHLQLSLRKYTPCNSRKHGHYVLKLHT